MYIWEDKRVHAFPKSRRPKANVTAQLDFELVYYNVAVQHISHDDTETFASPFLLIYL